jgi:hypothetical protein
MINIEKELVVLDTLVSSFKKFEEIINIQVVLLHEENNADTANIRKNFKKIILNILKEIDRRINA